MSTVAEQIEPLVAGDRLDRDEFMRRWEAMPGVKLAELIGGIVYMPSPLSIDHGDEDFDFTAWLGHYKRHTPGCKGGSNTTWFMGSDAPQADVHLRLLPECGGRYRLRGKYPVGAPELTAEVSLSSTSFDLHQKKDLYQQTGVQEYVVLLVHEHAVRWFRLVRGSYKVLSPGRDGVIRSAVFPGLWLHVEAFLSGDEDRVFATLDQGLASPEHQEFVELLQRRRSKSRSGRSSSRRRS